MRPAHLHANDNRSSVMQSIAESKLTVSAIALLATLSTSSAAWATIDNTVTATGSSPGNTDDVTATADEQVDVEDAAPNLAVTKTADVTTNVAVGDTITYTYTVENTGNVTLTEVALTDAHEGTGPTPIPANPTLTTGTASTDDTADNDWDSLAPGEIVTWTASYVVTQDDLVNQADNDLDNTVTATAIPAAGTLPPGPFEATETVDLEDPAASLAVTKTADDDTDVVVGQVITYTYVVTNDGNVPISNVSLADNVTAGSGATPTPIIALQPGDNASGNSTDDGLDNIYDLLQPGDTITFTGEYTVTQDDVDSLQ